MRHLAVLAFVLVAGCGGDSTSTPAANAGGSSSGGGSGGTKPTAGGSGGTKPTAGGSGGAGGAGASAGSPAGNAGSPGGKAGSAGANAGAAGMGGAGVTGGAAGAPGLGGSSAGTAGAAGASTAGAGGGSLTTLIRVHYPVAPGHALTLRGDAGTLTWTSGVALKAEADDTWTFATTAIDKAAELKPLLDDTTWSRGPNYHVAPGGTVDLYPHFTTTAGKITLYASAFHSQNLPDDRPIWAYLPPTYLENAKAFMPVVYMHDGQNLFGQPGAFGDWKVDDTMDAAAEDATIREAIVIGVGNTQARIYEYTPTFDASTNDGGGADAYMALLATELKPKVDADFRTLPGRDTTALVGSSLGGLFSAYAGLKQPSTWGLLGVMSPSTWWDNEVITADVKASSGAPLRALRLYVDSGDSGPSNDDVTLTKNLVDTYQSVGYILGTDLDYVVQTGGQHNETYWAERLPGALAFLLGPRPNLRGIIRDRG